jgi:hypothetical protein
MGSGSEKNSFGSTTLLVTDDQSYPELRELFLDREDVSSEGAGEEEEAKHDVDSSDVDINAMLEEIEVIYHHWNLEDPYRFRSFITVRFYKNIIKSFNFQGLVLTHLWLREQILWK